jgi:hypothetical protein
LGFDVTDGRYSVEVIEESGGVEQILVRENDLDAARALYNFCIAQFPNRLVVLSDRARVLARSDCK